MDLREAVRVDAQLQFQQAQVAGDGFAGFDGGFEAFGIVDAGDGSGASLQCFVQCLKIASFYGGAGAFGGLFQRHQATVGF